MSNEQLIEWHEDLLTAINNTPEGAPKPVYEETLCFLAGEIDEKLTELKEGS